MPKVEKNLKDEVKNSLFYAYVEHHLAEYGFKLLIIHERRTGFVVDNVYLIRCPDRKLFGGLITLRGVVVAELRKNEVLVFDRDACKPLRELASSYENAIFFPKYPLMGEEIIIVETFLS